MDGGWALDIVQGKRSHLRPRPLLPSPTVGSDLDGNDLFYLALKYDQREPSFPATARKDGNIAQVISRVRGRERQA